jgi:hypothetical protein
MKYFHVHPDDARRLRRWLYSNLLCFLAIAFFLMAIRFESSVPLAAMDQRVPGDPFELAMSVPPETAPVLPTSRSRHAVAPEGWRRTARGWEHVSTWPALPRPLGEIIRHQQDREPLWIQFILGTLRNVPPLAFALLQIVTVAAIVMLAKPRKLA